MSQCFQQRLSRGGAAASFFLMSGLPIYQLFSFKSVYCGRPTLVSLAKSQAMMGIDALNRVLETVTEGLLPPENAFLGKNIRLFEPVFARDAHVVKIAPSSDSSIKKVIKYLIILPLSLCQTASFK